MKIEILENFIGCPDGITNEEFKKGEKIEVTKEFADILIAGNKAKLDNGKEKKVVKVEETKEK